jgi:UDP-glucose 4-epimerase
VTIQQLAERVRGLCRSKSEIVLVPYESAYGPGFDDMRRRVPDLTRVKELIGWSPKHNLDAIITSVVDYVRSESGRAHQ